MDSHLVENIIFENNNFYLTRGRKGKTSILLSRDYVLRWKLRSYRRVSLIYIIKNNVKYNII